MGAYATSSNYVLVARKPLKRKRQRGFIDETMELIRGTHIEIDKITGEHKLMRGNEVVGIFTEEEEKKDE